MHAGTIQRTVLSVVAPAWLTAAWAATVTVNPEQEYQTIDGFGSFGPQAVWWEGPPNFSDEWLRQRVTDLGQTVVRDAIPPYLEWENDNADPNVLDMGRLTPNQGRPADAGMCGGNASTARSMQFLKAFKQMADSYNEPLKIIVSIWSPPRWMKKSGHECGVKADAPDPATTPHALKAGMAPELAEYFAAYVKYMEQNGVPIYALSPQNEPAFEEFYDCCVYSPEGLRDVIRATGGRFDREGIRAKIFMPEDIGDASRIGRFFSAAVRDTAGSSPASRHTDILAVHNYAGDGITPVSPTASTWNHLSRMATSARRPLWMTETSGYGGDWNSGFSYGKAIFAALKYGKIAAWVHFYDIPGKCYYAMKQFSRYIRPDAVGIGVSSDNNTVEFVAFRHKAKKTLTIVAVNTGATLSYSIAGPSIPGTFRAYRTSASENCVNLGTVSKDNVSFAGGSITTLVADNYDPPVSAAPRPADPDIGRRQPLSVRARVVRFDGRYVGEYSGSDAGEIRTRIATDRMLAPGAYCATAAPAAGAPARSACVKGIAAGR